jgi:hypothetical protein
MKTTTFSARLAELERRTVSAAQEVGEIRRRENDLV